MKAVVFISLPLLAAVLFWSMSGGQNDVPTELQHEPLLEHEVAVEPDDSLAVPKVALADEPSSAREELSRVVADAKLLAEDPASAEDVLQLHGRVVLYEGPSTELTQLNGALTLSLWNDGRGKREVIEVTDGRFTLDVKDVEYLTISDLQLEERNAQLLLPTYRYSVDIDELVIPAKWTKPVRLSVLGAVTGLHLSDVTVLEADRGHRVSEQMHPGTPANLQTRVSGVQSPIDLMPSTDETQRGSVSFYVRSPSYRWQLVTLDMSAGGEREVRLTAGGDLAIRILGDLGKRRAKLCLYATTGMIHAPIANFRAQVDDVIEIPSLGVGRYVAKVQIGEWYDQPKTLDEQLVEVIAGQRNVYDLVVEPPRAIARVKLAGTLVLPVEWGLDEFELEATFDGTSPDGQNSSQTLKRSELKQRAGKRDEWSFDFRRVVPGEYELSVSSGARPKVMSYPVRVSVGLDGAEHVRIVVPPPGNVLVRLVDKSGQAVRVDYLSWGVVEGGEGFFAQNAGALPSESDDSFAFRAPIGRISVSYFGQGYTSLEEEVQVYAGDNEFTFTLEQNCRLKFIFLDGETAVPLDGTWWPEPEHLDGNGECLYISTGRTGFQTALDQPGRYLFDMPTLPGFEPIPKQEITLIRGEEVTHQVQLVREH